MTPPDQQMQIATDAEQRAFEQFFTGLHLLRNLKILINSKDFTCQVGEWIIATLFDGQRAPKHNQEGWDVLAQGKYIQVKTHAKADGNDTRRSSVNIKTKVHIDELIILDFTADYKLDDIYIVPWSVIVDKVINGKLNWSAINEYKKNISDLPRQDVLTLFS